MPLTPFPIEQFGGLNMATDVTNVPIDVATDMLNVTLKRGGLSFRTRDGVSKLTASAVAASASLRRLGYSVSAKHILVGNVTDSKTYVVSTNTGTVVSSSVAKGMVPTSFANYGSSGSPIVYIADSANTVYTWDGAAFAVPVYTGTTPKGQFLAVTPWDNRLLSIGGFGTTSRVLFSDPGTPTTFQVNNWVDFEPGDGEDINAAVTWRDLVFVFKASKFFVIYGTSVQSDGSPVFNYRAVRGGLGVGPWDAGTLAIAGREGVYFINDQGIWLTTGGPAVKVSDALDELFLGDRSSAWSGPAAFPYTAGTSLAYHDGRLYVGMQFVGAAGLTFVLENGQWSVWQLLGQTSTTAFTAFVAVPATTTAAAQLFYTATGVPDRIYKVDPTATTDDGSAIPWSYTTGYSSAGGYFRQRIVSSGERKKHFKTDIIGSGTVTHQILALNARPNDVADTGGSVTLGTSPAVARGSRRRGVRGTYFAHKLSGSGAAVVTGLTYWLSEISLDT